MKVLARMNRIAWDRQRGRYVLNWRLPKDLHAVLSPEVCERISRDGKWFRDRFPKSFTPAQAAKLEAERLVEFNSLVDGARDALASPERRPVELARLTDKAAGMLLAQGDRLIALQEGMRRLHADHESVSRLASLGIAMRAPAEATAEPVDSESVIKLWVKHHSANHSVKPKAIKRKRAVLRELFAFLKVKPMGEVIIDPKTGLPGKAGEPWPVFDLAKADRAGLQRYKDVLDNAKGFEYLSHIKALYQTAEDNNRFANHPGGNPAAKVKAPPKPKGEAWEPYTEADGRRILIAARDAGPEIRWTHWVMCFIGGIVSEVADRKVSDFKTVDGIDVLEIPAGKTDYRPRVVPLHPALRLEGLFDYLDAVRRQHGPDAPIFPHIKPNANGYGAPVANRCRIFVRDIVGITDSNKQLNGWRKRYTNQIEDMKTPDGGKLVSADRQRYLCGHAPRDVHAKNYLKHPARETKPIIDRLIDPTVSVLREVGEQQAAQ